MINKLVDMLWWLKVTYIEVSGRYVFISSFIEGLVMKADATYIGCIHLSQRGKMHLDLEELLQLKCSMNTLGPHGLELSVTGPLFFRLSTFTHTHSMTQTKYWYFYSYNNNNKVSLIIFFTLDLRKLFEIQIFLLQ